jgi:hypothetical protein
LLTTITRRRTPAITTSANIIRDLLQGHRRRQMFRGCSAGAPTCFGEDVPDHIWPSALLSAMTNGARASISCQEELNRVQSYTLHPRKLSLRADKKHHSGERFPAY